MSGEPSRRRELMAALLAVVLTAIGALLAATPGAAATALGAQNGVGASTSAAPASVRASTSISPGQRLGKAAPGPGIVVASGVAANAEAVLVDGAGSGTRALNLRPNAADPNWGLTRAQLDKHLIGDGPYALSRIDPGGNPDVWWGHMQELASRPATATLKGGIEDVVGAFPKTGGDGTFQFGIRVSPASDGSWDLVTLLTKR